MRTMNGEINLKKIHDYLWEIPKKGGMLVPGRVYATERMLKDIQKDKALEQEVNTKLLNHKFQTISKF